MSVRRHSTLNLIGTLLPIPVTLLTTPYYLHALGTVRYGVLALVWLLLGYFGVFDFGLGRATAQRLAARPEASRAEQAASLWTGVLLNLMLGGLGGLVLYATAAVLFDRVFQLDATLRSEVQLAAPWLILAVPVTTLAPVVTGALEARLRFRDLNIASALGSIAGQTVPLVIALTWSTSLTVLIPAVIVTRGVVVSALFLLCHRALLAGETARLHREEIAPLLRFGGWVALTGLATPLMAVMDRFIIGALLGAKEVTYYSVPLQIAERTGVLPNALTSALYPRLAGAAADDEARALALRATISLAAIMTPVMLLGVLLMRPFLVLWVGPEIAGHAARTGEILMVGFWINAFARIPLVLLQARGHPDRVAKCHLAELLPYLGLLWIGIRAGGPQLAAVVFGLRVLFDWAVLSFLSGTLGKQVRLMFLPAAQLAAALMIATWLPGPVLSRLVMTGLLFSMTLAWSWWRAPSELRHWLLNLLACSFRSGRTPPRHS